MLYSELFVLCHSTLWRYTMNVVLVEDDFTYARIAVAALEKAGHRVFQPAAIRRRLTLETALAAVPQLTELGVRVAVVDGNLTSGDISGIDGRMVARTIREQCPGLVTIAWSTVEYDWGDEFVRKGKKEEDSAALVEAVDRAVGGLEVQSRFEVGRKVNITCYQKGCDEVLITVILGEEFKVDSSFVSGGRAGRIRWAQDVGVRGFALVDRRNCPNCGTQLDDVVVVLKDGRVRVAFGYDREPA